MNRYGTVGEARALFADCRAYSTRDQNKFFWMLFNSFSGPIDYSRFKRIRYFEEEPTNSLEKRLASEQLYSNASTVWKSISYAYDSAGLLSSFDGASVSYNHLGFIGSALGETVGYDAAGNIASRSQGGVSYTYSYLSSGLANRINSISGSNGWSRSYSYSGNSLGFPTAISESGSGAKSLSFSYHGELLHQAVTPSGTFTYYYDAKGRRIRKVGPSESHVYAYGADRLVLDTVIGGRAIHYIYGSDGALAFVLLNQNGSLSRYAASVDAMGRLLRLSSEDGSYAEYSYSLWGEPTLAYDNTPAGIGSLNRLLFKCYPYDDETGFYSLGSRHYDPKSGRFLEPDPTGYLDPAAMAGLNLYAYCNNDPVNYTDRTGHLAEWVFLLIGIGIGAAIGAGTNAVGQYISNGYSWDNFNWGSFMWSAAIGGASGALAMSTLGATAMIFANAGLSAIGSAGSHLIAGDDFGAWQTWLDIGVSGIFGGIAGALGGAGAMHSSNINAIRESAGVLKASASYFGVLDKIANGGYATLKGAHIALSITRNRLVSAWNGAYGMVVGRALSVSLFHSAWTSAGNMLFSNYWYPSLLGV